MSDIKLLVKKLSKDAIIPKRGSEEAAGYDLSAAHDITIPARGKAIVKTDLAVKLPEGCYGRIAPRSGLSWKHHMDVGAGVIDRDYRGNVGVVLFNHAEKDYEVKHGDRVAQLVLERIFTPEVFEVEELDATKRGAGGFGSTGMEAKRQKVENTEAVIKMAQEKANES
mmetsp:Transcript_7057/g.11624  ORF Transcript_7057/g.11624 Transcript_7057/m.11624 type:complete len:168 (+) Transcript_7057:35-538(+)|eukprot:jgi/Bigna1/141686/aug1.64_g16394